MRIDLTGVLTSGPARVGVPDPRVTIQMQQGSNLEIHVRVLDSTSGSYVSMLTGTLELSVKKKPADNPAAIYKTAPTPSAEGVFTILPVDTKNLLPGRYIFDVWLTLGGKRDAVIPLSTLLLESAATPAP